MTDQTITLDFAREERQLKVSVFEGNEKALRPYEILEVDWRQVDQSCREILTLFNRSNGNSQPNSEILDSLKKNGRLLFDLLIPSQAREKLAGTSAEILTLRLEDTLVHVPWELLYDGREFLCRRFAVGRIASTRQTPSARTIRAPRAPFNVLIIADPRGDLEASYREGLAIKTFLERRGDVFHVDFKSFPADIAFVRKNLRDYDIVHYAGHAKYDAQNPSDSGWLLSDGTLKAAEIAAMGGFQPMPALVFSNACQSGHTHGWSADISGQQIFGLANAFLLSGVQHYIGTFWETVDEPSSHFARRCYAAIAEGKAIGTSLREARQAPIRAGEKETLAWANYMLYGDPGREYRGAETSGKNLLGSTLGRWKQIFQAGALSDSVRTQPLLISLIGVLVLTLFYGAYSRHRSGVSTPGAVTSPSAMSVVTVVSPDVSASLSLSMNIIGQRKEPNGNYTEVIVREGSVLRSGDGFQVRVESTRPSYLYVLLYDSRGQASQLFPDPKIDQPGFVGGNQKVLIPDKDLWFWLDDQPGTETVYVVASEERVSNIRGLLEEMEKVHEIEQDRLSEEVKARSRIVERGVGGIAKGKTVSYPLSDGSLVRKVTDIVAGTGAVVRALSFRHE